MSKKPVPSLCNRLHAILTKTTTTTAAASAIVTTSTATTTINHNHPKRDLKLQKMIDKFKKSCEFPEFRADHRAYSKIIRRLTAAGRFSMIEDVLEHQKNFKDITNEQFVIRIIFLYGKAGMLQHARKLFDEMPELKCIRSVLSFNVLLSACIEARKFDEIEGIFKNLPGKVGITPDVVSFNTFIKAFCEMGNLDSASLMLAEMEKKGIEPDLITFNTLLNGCYANGRFEEGERIWGLMEAKNVVPNIRSFNSRLRGLVAEKGVQAAIELLGEMESQGVKPDVISYNAVIKGFCDQGKVGEVENWLGKLRKKSCKLDRVTYVTLIPFFCKKGDFDKALELCIETINKGLLVKAALFQPVVDGLVQESKIDEAKDLVELAKSNKYLCYKLNLPSAT